MLSSFFRKVLERVEAFSAKRYVIVTGNEACDLDSIASATAYAFMKRMENDNEETCYIPTCNIPFEDIQLRTEAVYWLNYCGIKPKTLFYHNNLERLFEATRKENLSLALVDHHDLPTNSIFKGIPVCDIIDHHPLSPDYVRPENLDFFRVERVGSCSSLVTEELMRRVQHDQIPIKLCQLLYGAILIDTIGLSPEGRLKKRATETDFKAAEQLETIARGELFTDNNTRDSCFKQISDAKYYIMGLSLWDLLRRDMKTVSARATFPAEVACSTICGMDFQELTFRQDFVIASTKFCEDNAVKMLVCITIGPVKKDNRIHNPIQRNTEILGMRRGIAIFAPPVHTKIAKELSEFLCEEEHGLDLRRDIQTAQKTHHFLWTATLCNDIVTRKQIIPIIVSLLQKKIKDEPSEIIK